MKEENGAAAAAAPVPAPAPAKPETTKAPEAAAPKKPAAAPTIAPGEMYKFTAVHNLVLFAVAFLLHLPFLVEDLSKHAYTVNRNGIVLITGASTGIGKHAAIHLAKKNFTVYAGVRNREDEAELLRQNLTKLVPISLDVTKPKDVNKAFDVVSKEVARTGLPFAGLVNNAALTRYVPFEYDDLKEVEALLSVNVIGVHRITQKFLPLLRASKGRIINLSSVLGRLAVPHYSAYAASKFALEGLSDVLRRELREVGVSVSVVEPGYVRSAIAGKEMESAKKIPEEAKATYPHLFTASAQEAHERHMKKGSSPSVTSSAIFDALASRYPKTRYAVAQVDDFPVSILLFLASVLPDRMADYLVLRE